VKVGDLVKFARDGTIVSQPPISWRGQPKAATGQPIDQLGVVLKVENSDISVHFGLHGICRRNRLAFEVVYESR